MVGPPPWAPFGAAGVRAGPAAGFLRKDQEPGLPALFLWRGAGRCRTACGIAHDSVSWAECGWDVFASLSATKCERRCRNGGNDRSRSTGCALGGVGDAKAGAVDARAQGSVACL